MSVCHQSRCSDWDARSKPGGLIVKKMVKGVLGRVSKGAKRPAAPSSQAAAPPLRKRQVIVDSDED